MDRRENNETFSEILGLVKSWIPWRSSEPANVSRDFWMPDQSCRVCYECDSQFTIFNRRHHCRLCGRIFCGKCTSNSVPVPSGNQKIPREEWDRIRVCNYCFKQWLQGNSGHDAGPHVILSTSPSGTSVVSPKSTTTADSSSFAFSSMPGSVEPYQQAQRSSDIGLNLLSVETGVRSQGKVAPRSSYLNSDMEDPYRFTSNSIRSDEEDDDYGAYQMDSESKLSHQVNDFYGPISYEEISNDDGSHKLHYDGDGELINSKSLSSSPLVPDGFDSLYSKKEELDQGSEIEPPSSMYAEDIVSEPVDFENNAALWIPPDPENEDDEKENMLLDDDDNEGDAAGEWSYFRTSHTSERGEYNNSDRTSEDHKRSMKNVVDGHFRALIAQLLQVENLSVSDEDGEENWLDIITSLSWEAANLLKPDMSKGGGMDPGGYVKVKCVASGRKNESMVVKGVVCKKNVAHRRMRSKLDKPRLLILGGALEYQRVSNQLSSFDTLLQQEKDHLKMAVAKIHADCPNILLVEKSVSRFAQEYLLGKDISLVLNIKRPLLERIARCTGAQIVPSVDHVSSQKLGSCDNFHVERVLENHGSAGQDGKKSMKTLMYFEGCPKPLGFTILLRGANGDELKKVKHVVQYGVFAAYHLALETSFLADEGASPELPLNSPITVALPEKSTSIESAISTVPGFSPLTSEKSTSIESAISTVPGFSPLTSEKSPLPQPETEVQRSNSVPASDLSSSINSVSSTHKQELAGYRFQTAISPSNFTGSSIALPPERNVSDSSLLLLPDNGRKEKNKGFPRESLVIDISAAKNTSNVMANELNGNCLAPSNTLGQGVLQNYSQDEQNPRVRCELGDSELSPTQQDGNENPKDPESIKEEFSPAPSDHQSILVSLSSRCVWKGTICERSHLLRIKYYGSFDKPLGRFLRDHLFDEGYQCPSCGMPSEAHVHCYTHRQGSLTISVKTLQGDFLTGQKDGKIWMWHRCLRCPRSKGFPPATRRVVMSDAAWGLSFGKFLELSFSNHAAASRVACCGHSLHRDCLRFYGFGKMVACFRYATIDVHSVYLPPSILSFNYENWDWIQREVNEVEERTELLFSEVLNALCQISDKGFGVGSAGVGRKTSESRRQIADLEAILKKEKAEFEENIRRALNREVKKDQPPIDILEIYRLRRQLLFQSYMWDHRLIYAASLDKNPEMGSAGEIPDEVQAEKPLPKSNTVPEMILVANSMDRYNSSDLANSNPNSGTNDKKFTGSTKNSSVPLRTSDLNGDSNNEKRNEASRSTSDRLQPQESKFDVRRTLSEGQIPALKNLSATLDAAWTGEINPHSSPEDSWAVPSEETYPRETLERQYAFKAAGFTPHQHVNSDSMEDPFGWIGMSFLNFYRSVNKNFLSNNRTLESMGEYHPVYISSFRDSELQGPRLLLPIGVNDTVVPVYDDEPTSIISYALVMPEYHSQLSDEVERIESAISLPSDPIFSRPVAETIFNHHRSLGSVDELALSLTGSRSSLLLDPLSYTKALHVRVSFGDEDTLGKVKYSVTCYYAKRFEALRKMCLPSEVDYIRSLSRCKKWGAQGGKSNVFFAKTLDDRFIIKQVTKTELESFIKFAPAYFKYLSESISTKSPTCLAKILGIYQVSTKQVKSGRETKIDVLVMENLLYGRTVTRLYDLKGSSRARYNPDSSGTNKVLLDQNLIESMPTSPIFLGNKAKRLLERAVWNDTAFLATVDVMDYSLLVGVDEEKHELVLGIIDFLRQYTWDKHLETWVKASGILGGPKNESPTVISPKQYKKRFRKAMTTYFLMVPDQWSPPSIIPSKSQSDAGEENPQVGTPVE